MTTAPYAFLNEVAPLCSLYSLLLGQDLRDVALHERLF